MDENELIETLCRLRYKPPTMWTVFGDWIPHEMLVTGQVDKEGWVEWKLLPRSVGVDPGFAKLEKEIGATFPRMFKLYYSRYYFLDGDLSMLRFPRSTPNKPFDELRDLILNSYFPERIKGIGLIPFASDGNDAGPLCFDTRQSRNDADYPIVLWDHDWVGTHNEISPTIFSSFTKLLECCVHLWSKDKTPYTQGIAGFVEIDPDGAGGPGRTHWIKDKRS